MASVVLAVAFRSSDVLCRPWPLGGRNVRRREMEPNNFRRLAALFRISPFFAANEPFVYSANAA